MSTSKKILLACGGGFIALGLGLLHPALLLILFGALLILHVCWRFTDDLTKEVTGEVMKEADDVIEELVKECANGKSPNQH